MVIQRTPQWTPQRGARVAPENETKGRGFRPPYILVGIAIAVAGTYLHGKRSK